MRIAAIYDIHGNLPALEAVLADVHLAGADQLVIGGDVVPGPMPRETLERLLHFDLPMHFIQGNGEVAVLAYMAGQNLGKLPEQAREAVQWTAQQLDPEHGRRLAAWPKTVRARVRELGDVLFCHATPQNENDVFTRLTPPERVSPAFTGVQAAVVVCGHTHMQFDRMIGSVRVVNAGSVGMPFGDPGAYWLLLGPGVELRRTTYDLGKAAERIRATRYPQAEEFATRNILQPPSEKEMLEAFTRVELK